MMTKLSANEVPPLLLLLSVITPRSYAPLYFSHSTPVDMYVAAHIYGVEQSTADDRDDTFTAC